MLNNQIIALVEQIIEEDKQRKQKTPVREKRLDSLSQKLELNPTEIDIFNLPYSNIVSSAIYTKFIDFCIDQNFSIKIIDNEDNLDKYDADILIYKTKLTYGWLNGPSQKKRFAFAKHGRSTVNFCINKIWTSGFHLTEKERILEILRPATPKDNL